MNPRVLICGSRGYPYRNHVEEFVDALPADATVIAGGARGPDAWAEARALWRGLSVETYTPDWDKHGKKAGILRNLEMLEDGQPTEVVAFYDGVSKGTAHTIREAEKRKLPVTVYSL